MPLTRRDFLVASGAVILGGCIKRVPSIDNVLIWGGEGFRDGSFMRPRAIGVHGDHVYVIDTTGRVQVFTTDGSFVRLWKTPSTENGTPTDITFTSDERVLIPDTHYSKILEYTHDGEALGGWGEYGSEPGRFIYPTGIVQSLEGEYYISEFGENAERVQVYDDSRTFKREWGSEGDEPGQFNRAMSIELDENHIVYVADTSNHRVQCFDTKGNLLNIIGTPGTARGQLKYPHDLALAPDGTLLVCEYGSHRVSRFDPDGAFIGAFGSPGRAPGQFNSPRGVTVSDRGDVFIADTDNHRVQRVSLEAIA